MRSVLFFLLATLERRQIEFNFTCSIRPFCVVFFTGAAYQAWEERQIDLRNKGFKGQRQCILMLRNRTKVSVRILPALPKVNWSYPPVLKIYRVSLEEPTKLREGVPNVKIYRYNPKHLYPKLNGYGDNGQRSLKLWQLLHTYWLANTY